MKKKRGTKEVIEDSAHPYIEHRFIKHPGKEAVEVTDYSKATETTAHTDPDKFYRAVENAGAQTDIHTHPTDDLDVTKNYPLPSGGDLEIFLKNNMRSMVIAVREASYKGNLIGYHVIKKTKLTPTRKSEQYGLALKETEEYKSQATLYVKKEPDKLAKIFDEFTKKYHIQHRLVPAKGYEVNEARSAFVKKGGLEKKLVSAIILISLVTGAFFFSPTLTGNTISNLSEKSSLGIGSIFFILALIATFIYLKNKNK